MRCLDRLSLMCRTWNLFLLKPNCFMISFSLSSKKIIIMCWEFYWFPFTVFQRKNMHFNVCSIGIVFYEQLFGRRYLNGSSFVYLSQLCNFTRVSEYDISSFIFSWSMENVIISAYCRRAEMIVLVLYNEAITDLANHNHATRIISKIYPIRRLLIGVGCVLSPDLITFSSQTVFNKHLYMSVLKFSICVSQLTYVTLHWYS